MAATRKSDLNYTTCLGADPDAQIPGSGNLTRRQLMQFCAGDSRDHGIVVGCRGADGRSGDLASTTAGHLAARTGVYRLH